MPRISFFFHVLIEMVNAKFPYLAQWRLQYSDIAQKKSIYSKLSEGNYKANYSR